MQRKQEKTEIERVGETLLWLWRTAAAGHELCAVQVSQRLLLLLLHLPPSPPLVFLSHISRTKAGK